MGIESVVDKENAKLSNGIGDAACSACEMAVVWIQSQLRQNMTQERILDYVNDVREQVSIRTLLIKSVEPFYFPDPDYLPLLLFFLDSYASVFPAQWESLQWTVHNSRPCLLFHSPLEAKSLILLQRRYD